MRKSVQFFLIVMLSMPLVACTYSPKTKPTITETKMVQASETKVSSPTTTLRPTPSQTPIPSQTKTQLPSITVTSEPTKDPFLFSRSAVVLVPDWDVLNVRAKPGPYNPIIEELPPQADNFIRTGPWKLIGDVTWEAVELESGKSGWVHTYYVTDNVPEEYFCSDPKVEELLLDFRTAILTEDAELLARVTSPMHGLLIRHNWWNTEVGFSFQHPWTNWNSSYLGDVTANIFTDEMINNWGIQDGSGFEIIGSFSEIILPKLQEVVDAEHLLICNDLEASLGATAGMKTLPFEYSNFHYYAYYLPPADQDENLFNWRTWVVGIEYNTDGKPYIVYLVQYHWEI